MDTDKENDESSLSTSQFGTPGASYQSPQVGGVNKTPIRPLTAAYKAARSDYEVMSSILTLCCMIILCDI